MRNVGLFLYPNLVIRIFLTRYYYQNISIRILSSGWSDEWGLCAQETIRITFGPFSTLFGPTNSGVKFRYCDMLGWWKGYRHKNEKRYERKFTCFWENCCLGIIRPFNLSKLSILHLVHKSLWDLTTFHTDTNYLFEEMTQCLHVLARDTCFQYVWYLVSHLFVSNNHFHMKTTVYCWTSGQVNISMEFSH